ncbi:disks large-associated protein 5 isoform X2 [Syngnathus acus]|uniref:disks large-associated protein 5 isoform X2 n=1 Tax=Syngnathus acus TaxID=161584 RepID=UPI001885BA15|nr:disks large-associated protein 5 isoform X2 [Syngnathus acus]
MESQFSYLRHRDSSVDMLRIKMSRRISQNQKENRERAMDARRQLDNLQEQEQEMDASSVSITSSTMKDLTNVQKKSAKDKAAEEKRNQLARWKERKALEKEKQKRERERKGVFKTGLYHPKDTVFSLIPKSEASTKAKETTTNTALSQSSRVTRSKTRQQQQQSQKPSKTPSSNMAAKKDPTAAQRPTRGQPVITAVKKNEVRAGPSTRAANKAVQAAPAAKKQPKNTIPDQGNTQTLAVLPLPRATANQKNCTDDGELDVHPLVSKLPELNVADHLESEDEPHEGDTCSSEENPVPSSFAPEGFVFQAPAGLENFTFVPLTPSSANRFFEPRPMPQYLTRSRVSLCDVAVFRDACLAEPSQSSPPKSPHRTPPPLPVTLAGLLDSKHDVAYFRSQMDNETDRLTSLCDQWKTKAEDESIPEEVRGHIRTAVGQARLLMKERFNQFSKLVDDCELHRGEKITTCSDLEGFWDMIYFQIEDVNKKFDALQGGEARGWVEEHKPPPPRQRKTVKVTKLKLFFVAPVFHIVAQYDKCLSQQKPAAAPAKPTSTKAGAKSGLAAVKAAMRAQKKAAEAAKAAGGATDAESRPSSQGAQSRSDTVVFDGGFFRVESPAKTQNCVRRSSRLSAAAASLRLCTPPTTPRRVTRQSLASGLTAATPVQHERALTPLRRVANTSFRNSPEPLPVTHQPSQRVKKSTRFSFLAGIPASAPLTSQEDVLLDGIKENAQPPQAETNQETLLLFTPNTGSKIRQSTCPNDLIYFTPLL